MEVLFVELSGTDPQALIRWWVCEDGSVIASGTGPLGNIATEASEHANARTRLETVVLLPDQEFLYIKVEIPGRSQARVRQAAPFAVEPFLTEEIDDVHIALGEIRRSEAVPCLVINKSRLESYMSALEQSGIRPSVVTSPGMLIDSPGDLVLIESSSTITLRTPDQLAVVAPDALGSTVPFAIPRDEAGITIKCIGTETVATAVRHVLDQGNIDDVEIELISYESLLASVNEPTSLLNLQQGTYATKDSGVTVRQNLNKTALVAGICVIVASGIFLIQGFWADLQTNRLLDESLDIYETVYNTRDLVGNPVFRMQERMGARIDERSTWLRLLESVVGATADVEVRNLDFNESQNKMGITFFADSFQEFEEIRSRIENLGMNVEVNVAEQQANRVWARVTLSTP